MLKKSLPILFLASFIQPGYSYYQDRGPYGCCNPYPSLNQVVCCHPFEIILQLGDSYSNRSHITADPRNWDPSPEGYSNDLDKSVVYAAGVGYQWTPLFSTNVLVSHRPSFDYRKFQTSGAVETPGFLADKTRFFDFQNTDIMFDAIFHSGGISRCLAWQVNCCNDIQIFFGGGVGVAYNTVSNFHTEPEGTIPGDPVRFPIASVIPNETKSDFAWDLTAGLEWRSCNRFIVGVGYRYLDGGDFQSNNYVVNTQPDGRLPHRVHPWKGDFTTNEVYLSIGYML